MDDEEQIRIIFRKTLTRMNYEVEVAVDGNEMIELYKRAKERQKPFNAVIMDLTVAGGMGGEEAINRLLEIDPEIRAIVSSSNIDDPIMDNFKKYGFRAALPKPFEIDELSKTLQRVIMVNGNTGAGSGQ
ncbi:MAG: putative two-component sensor kinase [Candidatus Scalindua rubra]|uniref:Putative two-component sensor kinase n=1 Tax=Candidatus Scalindua rubra TaxID=1872076 RepID=A0A1E3X6J7_9BACT|nr:MAG: putative two-component sensor kinase [Candidatus Scalindua rubra]